MEEDKSKEGFERRYCEPIIGNDFRQNSSPMPPDSSSSGLSYPYYFDEGFAYKTARLIFGSEESLR